MSRRSRRAEAEAARVAEERAAHLAGLPEDVRPLVAAGWESRDADHARLESSERKRRLSLVRDGLVLFLAVELLLSGPHPVRLTVAALAGALLGLSWIPLVGRGLGLQLLAPLTAAPVFVGIRLATAGGQPFVDLGMICGVFVLCGIAAWIGFDRDEALHGM